MAYHSNISCKYPKTPSSTGPSWQNPNNEWWQLLAFSLSVPGSQTLLEKNHCLSIQVPRKIHGHQPHLGLQHCPAKLVHSSGYLILSSPTITFAEFLYFSQTSSPLHPFSIDGLASHFMEKITITWELPQFSSIKFEIGLCLCPWLSFLLLLQWRKCPVKGQFLHLNSRSHPSPTLSHM